MRRQPETFILWGAEHRAVLVLTGLGILAVILARTRLQERRGKDAGWRRAIAVALIVNELIELGLATAQGTARVPFQLCDLAVVLTAWALWSLRPLVSELAYFWGVAGSLQAILTPDVHAGFPSYEWVKFFLTHCGVVLCVTYLAVTGRVSSTPQTVWRVFGLTNLYAAVAGLLNWRFGTNYGYLAHKPLQPSLLDYFGPWPYYILVMEVAALLSFFLYRAPLRWMQR